MTTPVDKEIAKLEGKVFGPRRGTRSHPLHSKRGIARVFRRSHKLRLLYFRVDRLFLSVEAGTIGRVKRKGKRPA